MTNDPSPDLFVDGFARLTGQVSDRDPDDPEDYAAARITVLVPTSVLLSARQARTMASRLIDYADEVDRQNGVV